MTPILLMKTTLVDFNVSVFVITTFHVLPNFNHNTLGHFPPIYQRKKWSFREVKSLKKGNTADIEPSSRYLLGGPRVQDFD